MVLTCWFYDFTYCTNDGCREFNDGIFMEGINVIYKRFLDDSVEDGKDEYSKKILILTWESTDRKNLKKKGRKIEIELNLIGLKRKRVEAMMHCEGILRRRIIFVILIVKIQMTAFL